MDIENGETGIIDGAAWKVYKVIARFWPAKIRRLSVKFTTTPKAEIMDGV